MLTASLTSDTSVPFETMKIFVETERLILREIIPTDDHDIFELYSDTDILKFLSSKPLVNIEQAQKVIETIRRQYMENGIGRWAIIDKSTKEFLGWTGLKVVRERRNNLINIYDLGYRLKKKHWG